MTDSLLAPLDTLIACQPARVAVPDGPVARPADAATRPAAQGRIRALGARRAARPGAVSRVRAPPDPARQAGHRGQHRDARRLALGSLRDLEYENAQLRAAMGEWVPSAQAWRRALVDRAAPGARVSVLRWRPRRRHRETASATALALLPAEAGPRRALAELELTWGRPQQAWDALRAIRPDSVASVMWEEFGERAYSEERWALARDAFTRVAVGAQVTRRRAARRGGIAARGLPAAGVRARADLRQGERRGARGREVLPLHVTRTGRTRARGRRGGAHRAGSTGSSYPAQRMRMAQIVATAWVRARRPDQGAAGPSRRRP